jgi:hypothetical protein
VHVRLGPGGSAAGVAGALEAGGLGGAQVAPLEPSLEDVFMDLVGGAPA